MGKGEILQKILMARVKIAALLFNIRSRFPETLPKEPDRSDSPPSRVAWSGMDAARRRKQPASGPLPVDPYVSPTPAPSCLCASLPPPSMRDG